MGNRVASFRELRVYGAAFALAMEVWSLCRTFPREERYGLVDQLPRASRSVCANIAEAWRRRRYPKAFVSKLNDAEAEAEETRVFLDFARECGYLSPADHARLDRAYDRLIAQLVTMARGAHRWTIGRDSGRKAGEARPLPQSPSPPGPPVRAGCGDVE